MTLEQRLLLAIQAIGLDIKVLTTAKIPAGGTAGQVLKKTSGADYAVAWEDEALLSPAFTRTDGRITRIDYESGAFKTLTYSDGRLQHIDTTRDGQTRRRTLLRSDGVLTGITDAVL